MKEQIYTIPINESFEQKKGCPFCRIQQDLNKSSVEYVMGAAMMEPDVRISTNQKGFCRNHYSQMLKLKNRLSLALMLQSHLPEQKKKIKYTGNSKSFFKKQAEEPKETCYICDRVQGFMGSVLKNFLYLYEKEPKMKEQLMEQEFICLPHAAKLNSLAPQELQSKTLVQFQNDLTTLNQKYLDSIQEDVDTFCKSFDYRFHDIDLSQAKDSCERAAIFLSGIE